MSLKHGREVRAFLEKLKSRSVFRVAAAYGIVGWMLVEIASVVFEAFKFPDWALQLLIIMVVLGFPLALVLAWAYEITPQGVRRELDIDRSTRVTQQPGRLLDRSIIALLAVALLYLAFRADWGIGPRTAGDLGDGARTSIAVLPFVNMSAEEENEYFSDGLSEELLNLLAKIPELRVAARTSAFSFKGKDLDIPTVAARLNVGHVLEGSVRKSGDRVRIATQLIDADSGYHLWSETYDRTLNDIFLVQDEIAAAVVEALKVTLLGDVAVEATKVDPEAFSLYLQGRHFYRSSKPDGYEQAINYLQQSLAIDPDYAPAWDVLGMTYIRQADQGLLAVDEGYEKGRAAVERALQLDPDLAVAHAHLGWIAMTHDWDFAAADRHIERALALEPGSYAVLSHAGTLAFNLGRLDEAIAIREEAVARNPVSRAGHHNLASAYYNAGHLTQAQEMYRRALALRPGYLAGQFYLGLVLLAQGDSEAALATFEEEDDEGWRLEGRSLAYHALGQAGASDAALAELKDKFAGDMAYQIAEVHAFRGEPDAAFDWLERAYAQRDGGLPEMKTNPLMKNLHEDPRWDAFLGKIRLSDL